MLCKMYTVVGRLVLLNRMLHIYVVGFDIEYVLYVQKISILSLVVTFLLP